MGSRLFQLFCEMIDGAPASAVLSVAEVERRMFVKDLATGRMLPDAVTNSILSFCTFLRAVATEGRPFSVPLPIDHLALYRNTVERLVDAGELPFFAKELFDETYGESLATVFTTPAAAESALRILHLEDDELDAELVELSLHRLGVPVAVTRVASEGAFQNNIRIHAFDAVISDSSLPGFDTLKAVAIARERFPQIPFVFLSGNVNPRVKAETFRRGASDYVDKSDLPRLIEVIRDLCVTRKREAASV